MAETEAKTVFDAMAYQIAKEIGAMAAVLHGRVDAVLFTGGMAHSQRLVSMLIEYVNWIAPSPLSRRGRTAGPHGRCFASASPRRATPTFRY